MTMCDLDQEDSKIPAPFFDRAFRHFDPEVFARSLRPRVLDFGCGAGQLVRALRALGYDASGTDIAAAAQYWPAEESELRAIQESPYRLPFQDASFDFVVSTSVLEHAQNTAIAFGEIRRVLRPGGFAMHIYPSRWYLPAEPHIYVPFSNWFWPRYPRWAFSLWAMLGVRNEFQTAMTWREVVGANVQYEKNGLHYLSDAEMTRISLSIFDEHIVASRFLMEQSPGSLASLLRRLPIPTNTARNAVYELASLVRMRFIVQRVRPK